MLDGQLLNDFRDWVNSNDWTLFEYTNRGNKNQWNCICSAMDWIDVSVQYMGRHPLTSIGGERSIELFSYIACVDIIVEAIEQLNRVICSTHEHVFENDNSCFPNNQFHQTDRDYFKTIRACFGAHPVNLSDPEDPDNKDAKRFASWSGGYVGPGDFSVFLYSNRIDGKNIILGINFSQIDSFAEKYYNHLTFLKCKLEQQYKAFCEEKREEKFECAGDAITRLNILKEECKRRLNNDYYKYSIKELIRTFQTPITNENNLDLVNQFLDYLNLTIDEIYFNLQYMTLVELKKDIHYHSDKLPLQNGWAYWLEKLNEARLGHGYPQEMWIKNIEEIFKGQFIFEFKDAQELYVLVQATLYRLSQNA